MALPSPRTEIDAAASDDDLVRACLQGDARAWAELVRRYGAYVYAVATRAYRLSPQAADEVFQDVWVRTYDGMKNYRGSGELRGWIRQVTISACREHFRRGRRHDGVVSIDGVDVAEAEVADLDQALDVRAAVGRLKDPCRSTIELAFFEDRTQAETARALAVPEGTVAARISRCLKRLRSELQGNLPVDTSKEMR